MFASLNTLVYDVQTYYIIITGKISENIFTYEIFLSLTYPGVVNLVRLGISVCNQVSARSQYLVTFLSMCWITSGHTIHPPIEEILTPPLCLQSSWTTSPYHYNRILQLSFSLWSRFVTALYLTGIIFCEQKFSRLTGPKTMRYILYMQKHVHIIM